MNNSIKVVFQAIPVMFYRNIRISNIIKPELVEQALFSTYTVLMNLNWCTFASFKCKTFKQKTLNNQYNIGEQFMLALEEITKTELCKLHICSKGAIRLFFLLNGKRSVQPPKWSPPRNDPQPWNDPQIDPEMISI